MVEINKTLIDGGILDTLPTVDFSAGASLLDVSLQEYMLTVKPLLFFVLGLVAYAIFVFKFYKFLARRDIIALKLDRYAEGFSGFLKRLVQELVYVVETLVLVPLCVFFWFGILTTFLLVMTKSSSAESVILTAVALVTTVRIAAYYNETLSQDLAKMVPFALLGIYLVDVSYFSLGHAIELIKEIPQLWKHLTYYLIFVMAIEVVMRIIQVGRDLLVPKKAKSEEEK